MTTATIEQVTSTEATTASQRADSTTTASKPPISVFLSTRIKLSPLERELLKDAFRKRMAEDSAVSSPSSNPFSSVQSFTSSARSNVLQELGMSNLTWSELINTRESLALPLVMKIQKVLGVPIVDRERLKKAMNSYLDYVFPTNEDGDSFCCE